VSETERNITKAIRNQLKKPSAPQQQEVEVKGPPGSGSDKDSGSESVASDFGSDEEFATTVGQKRKFNQASKQGASGAGSGAYQG